MFNIDFEPVGRRGLCDKDQSLYDCAHQLNVDIISICGGGGTCGHCKVQIISGSVSEPTQDEQTKLSDREMRDGYRLACQTFPQSHVKVHVPPESLTAVQRTQVEGLNVDVTPEPAIQNLEAFLSIPSLTNPLADDINLWNALGLSPGRIDLEVQRKMSVTLRSLGWKVRVALRNDEIVALAGLDKRWLGMAVDIGTTKIAGYLLDMQTGKTLASKGLMNPQISYGEDVVTRIVAATKSPQDAARLQNLVSEALCQLVVDLCAQVEADPEDIVDAVIVGNTAIHHLFLGLPVKQLGLSPYLPAVSTALDLKARDVGLKIAPGAYVHLLSNIAGYIGADHIAMLLATRLAAAEKTTLALDIGTNTEICLNYRGHLTSVSCASGPAFEGAHIRFGMRAAPGAIEHMRLSEDRLEIQTIAGEAVVGICGSGLLDVVAQLRLNDILDKSGRMGTHVRVQDGQDGREFVLVERPGQSPISVSQKDVREMQLAKAAIRLGIQALVSAEGIQESDIEHVIIAGAFGTFIDVSSAVSIGMLPPLPLDNFEQVGNAAGTGARLALISVSQRAEAQSIAARDGYIELARVPNFNRKFAEATYLC